MSADPWDPAWYDPDHAWETRADAHRVEFGEDEP